MGFLHLPTELFEQIIGYSIDEHWAPSDEKAPSYEKETLALRTVCSRFTC
jgi:hypothetical protein